MAKKKPDEAHKFAQPFSVLLFAKDAKELERLSAVCGVGKSALIRKAVDEAIKRKIFRALEAS